MPHLGQILNKSDQILQKRNKRFERLRIENKKNVPPVPPLLVFPLYIGIYGGHTMPKNVPPMCPLRAPPSFPYNLKHAWKQGLLG